MNVPRHNKAPIDTSVYNRMKRNEKPSFNIVDKIRKVVTSVTGIDPYLDDKYQGTEFVKSRQLFMYFIRKYAKLSLYATGQLIGKDHSTVVHAEKCVKKYASIEKEYYEMYDAIEEKIKLYK